MSLDFGITPDIRCLVDIEDKNVLYAKDQLRDIDIAGAKAYECGVLEWEYALCYLNPNFWTFMRSMFGYAERYEKHLKLKKIVHSEEDAIFLMYGGELVRIRKMLTIVYAPIFVTGYYKEIFPQFPKVSIDSTHPEDVAQMFECVIYNMRSKNMEWGDSLQYLCESFCLSDYFNGMAIQLILPPFCVIE